VALVIRAACDPALPLSPRARLGILGVVVLAIAVLSLPKETLQELAAPVPVTPGRVLAVLGLPCYAALALFVTAALVARRGTPDGARTESA
jgi:hypothetical protein